MTQTAIVTGANGFIGARIVLHLLKQGWRVYAAGRGRQGVDWRARVVTALDDIDGEAVDRVHLSELDCWDVDLTEPGLGLNGSVGTRFSSVAPLLIHVAGDTRFTPSDPTAQRRINVDATLNVLRTLGPMLSRAVHVSTAYVAGDRQGVIRETDFQMGQGFRNPYEASKLDAELAVRELCEELDVPLAIVRPSIVINDTRTGRSSTFTHLNALIEVVNRIQEHYGLSDGEVVSKVIRLAADPEACPNLIPVDPMVEALLKIAQDPRAPGRAYHLCHPAPQSNAAMVGLIAKAIGIQGKLDLSYVTQLPDSLSYTEKMIIRSLKVYLPYMNDRSSFDLSHTTDLLPDYATRFPPLGMEYLEKVIHFQRQTRMQ